MADNIKVYARFRPLVGRDLRLSAAARAAAFETTSNTIRLKNSGSAAQPRHHHGKQQQQQQQQQPEQASFCFDDVFDAATTQEQLHDRVGRIGVQQLLEGYNSTILTYGQTGSGKTFSMYGDEASCWRDWDTAAGDVLPADHGLVPRVVATLLDEIAERHAQNSEIQYVITCSFLEIYNEKIKDLFDPSTKKKVRVRDTKREGVWVQGLSQETVGTKQDVADLVRLGFGMRAVGMTLMNERSSRSHCIFILNLHQNYPDGSSKVSKLNLVDLAGSERVNRSGVEGQAMREAQNINKSLSCLGICINALAEQGRQHIPYRDSALTHLLKESLGGNAKTFLVIALSQCRIDAEESVSTLRFGARAKTVKNRAVVNVQKSNDELEAQLDALRRYVRVLEAENARLRASGGDDGGAAGSGTVAHSSSSSGSRPQPSTGFGNDSDSKDPGDLVPQIATGPGPGPGSVGASSFVQIDMECQALRRRVKGQDSTIAALKSTFAVLMSRLTESQSEVKALGRENQALELDLRVGRVNNASTAVAVSELESATRILKNREAEIFRREKAIAEARVEVENESDEVRRAIKKQCEQDIAFRQRDSGLRQRMDEFEAYMQKKNREMLAAQARLDQAAAQLMQLQSAVGGAQERPHQPHQSSATQDGNGDKASIWQLRAERAEDQVRGLTRDLDEAQALAAQAEHHHHGASGTVPSQAQVLMIRSESDAGTPPATGAPVGAHLGGRGDDVSSPSDRTEFPKLWEAAGKKASLQLFAGSADDDDTTRGLATIVEGLRLRRMQLMEQKQQLFSPTSGDTGSAGAASPSGVPNAVSFSDDGGAAQREEWRRHLRSRGGVK